MIVQIEHTKKINAKKIWTIFQASYTIEADLLNAINFPPLKRTISNFIKSNTKFYGFYNSRDLCGAIEIDHNNTLTHIQSLVVDPKHFRKGIAKKLVSFVLSKYRSNLFTVETGLKNIPAIKLYTNFNFKEVKQWDTDHNVRKISFELKR